MRRRAGTVRFGMRAAAALILAALAAGCESGPGDSMFSEGPSVALFAQGQDGKREKAKLYYRDNNFGLAEATFRAVLEKNPRDAEAWTGLGASYDRLGRFDLADKAYARAMEVAGRRPEILNNMGYSYLLRGEHGKAKETFAEAASLAPGNPVILANLELMKTL